MQRCGLDVENDFQNIFFSGVQLDPRFNFRAYTVSDEVVPTEGWEVFDGGWAVFVVNPEGMVLGGEFAGVHVPVGTIFSFQDFVMVRDGDKEPLVIPAGP
jgi:hypothetical protein